MKSICDRGIHSVDIIGTENGYAHYIMDGYKTKKAKLYYRHERTWDDHMGNTPCGLYFIARFDNGCSARFYLCEFPEYR